MARKIPKQAYYESWESFRLLMPYGYIRNEETKEIQLFNRNYSHVGCKTKAWRKVPKSWNGEQIFFYGDGSKPLQSEEMIDRYRAKLQELLESGYKVIEVDSTFPQHSIEEYISSIQSFIVVPNRLQNKICL